MRGSLVRVGLLLLLVVAACAPTTGTPGSGPSSARPGGPSTSSGAPGQTPKPTPPPPTVGTPGPEGLTITVDDGSGGLTTWQLSCEPPGGDHPDPAAACAALAEHADALAPVPADRQCTQQFGGPQTATVTGTWQGRAVDSRFSLRNGCEIARWTALAGLLPPAGA